MTIATIDFSSVKFNLKERAELRMLSQFYDSKVLKLLLGVYASEVQELSDAIYQLLIGRTLSNAQGEQLDAIGRIVGLDRKGFDYSAQFWFAPDEDGVQPDNGHWWVQNQQQAVKTDMDDTTYRKWIWLKILENHNLFSSNPEIKNQIFEGIEETIGIERDGAMNAKLYISSNMSLTNKNLISYNEDTELTDNDYMFAYPATTDITDVEEI